MATDSLMFYAKELTVQLGGGLALGGFLNFFFPSHSRERIRGNPGKVVVEVLLQTTVSGAAALFFIGFLRGRGIDPQTTAIGLAPFWIYYLGAQHKLTNKTIDLLDYAGSKLEALDPALEKDIAEIKKQMP